MSRWDDFNVLATNDGESEPRIKISMAQDKSKMKNLIPARYHRKYKKYVFIAAGVTIAVIFIVLIAEFCMRGSDKQTTNAPTNYRSKLVLLINETKLLQFDSKTTKTTLIFETNKSVAAFDVHADQRIYWTELVDTASTSLKAFGNNTVEILIEDARFNPRGMVLDHITDNLYVVDEAAGNLVVVSIRSGEYALLMSELIRPHEIVLDPEEGLMFILELSTSILRARMDGTEVNKIVSNSGATSLTLDPERKRLYWINDFMNIESSDYDGKCRQSFFNDTATIISLAVLEDRLYWVRPGYGHPSSLLSCKIIANDTCVDRASHTMTNLDNPKYIKIYSLTHGTLNKNPCEADNGGCQQLCLLTVWKMRSCACRMGWQLTPDKRSCREVRDFLLYPQGGFVRVKSIDGAEDLVWPTPFEIDSVQVKGEIDFDYDSKNDDFYWSDDIHIYKMKLKGLNGGKRSTILSVNASSMVIQDIAYDWYTGNMYFVQRSKSNLQPHSLMLFNVDRGEAFQKTLYTHGYNGTQQLDACPQALALHPAERSIFFTVVKDPYWYIQHANMTGSSSHEVYLYKTLPLYGPEYKMTAVDYTEDRMYWMDCYGHTIKHSNFDRSDVKETVIGEMDARKIYVHRQWLYISNHTNIWRVHKETGLDALRITSKMDEDKGLIAGVKVFSESVQFDDKGNACRDANGGCEQFCLNGDGPVCECKDGMRARGSKCV